MVRSGPLRARARGFTLIEAMVASVVAVTMLSAAIALLIAGARAHRRHVEMGRLKRSAAMLVDQIASELRQAGLGVPGSGRAELGGEPYPPPILQATSTSIVFSADLPRPDSNFNGMSSLADDQSPLTLPSQGLAVLNEMNGNCDVYIALLPCTTDSSSLLFPTALGTGCELNANSRTCPWALGRYREDEFILIVNGFGKWVERQLNNPFVGTNILRRYLSLTSSRPPITFFTGPNRGYISTPDRVFYRLNADTVERKQCWSSVGPTATVAGLLAGCFPPGPDTATEWEPLASGVVNGSALTFNYYDGNGAVLPVPVPLNDLRRIRRVEIQLHMERALPDASPLTYDAFVSVSLRQ